MTNGLLENVLRSKSKALMQLIFTSNDEMTDIVNKIKMGVVAFIAQQYICKIHFYTVLFILLNGNISQQINLTSKTNGNSDNHSKQNSCKSKETNNNNNNSIEATASHIAALNRFIEIMSLLLACGSDIRAINKNVKFAFNCITIRSIF